MIASGWACGLASLAAYHTVDRKTTEQTFEYFGKKIGSVHYESSCFEDSNRAYFIRRCPGPGTAGRDEVAVVGLVSAMLRADVSGRLLSGRDRAFSLIL